VSVYLTHEEASELLGAFALDAVEVDDDVAIREHLVSCMRCESELAHFHEVAGLMANAGGDAPQDLWDRIAAQAEAELVEALSTDRRSGGGAGVHGRGDDDGDASVVTMFRPPADRKARSGDRWTRRMRFVIPLGTVAALVVIAVLGLQIEHMNHRIGQLDAISADQGLSQAVQAALLDPQAKQVELTSSSVGGHSGHGGGSALAELVVLPSGTGFLINHEMPGLPSGETYQLWGQSEGRMISIGLLGDRPTDIAMTIGQPASFDAYAVTIEHAGGSVSPTLPAVAASASLAT
jgi:anti-sigma-K factor RskA